MSPRPPVHSIVHPLSGWGLTLTFAAAASQSPLILKTVLPSRHLTRGKGWLSLQREEFNFLFFHCAETIHEQLYLFSGALQPNPSPQSPPLQCPQASTRLRFAQLGINGASKSFFPLGLIGKRPSDHVGIWKPGKAS